MTKSGESKMKEQLNNELSKPAPDGLAAELIWGVKAIADEIGRTERQAYHL
jgi:hypothetical protein